jgi:microcystin-dependent protein
VLLIDLDNCPTELPSTAVDFSRFDRVIACHGVSEPRVTLSTAARLASPLVDGRLEILRMKHAGRNAADFGLAFFAGRLIETEPESSTFVIISKDADLDHVVELIQALGRTAHRVATLENARNAISSRPTPPHSASASHATSASHSASASHAASASHSASASHAASASHSASASAEIIEISMDFVSHFRTFPKSRPARRKTLLRSIANLFHISDQTTVRRVVEQLEASGHLRFGPQDQVEYIEDSAARKSAKGKDEPERVPDGDAMEPSVDAESSDLSFPLVEKAPPLATPPAELPRHHAKSASSSNELGPAESTTVLNASIAARGKKEPRTKRSGGAKGRSKRVKTSEDLGIVVTVESPIGEEFAPPDLFASQSPCDEPNLR